LGLRAIFNHGIDDELWDPGTTLVDTIKNLKESYIRCKEMFDMQTKLVVALEIRLIKMEEQLKNNQ
jgi:hypothetical protein